MTDRFAHLGPYSELVDVAKELVDRPAGDLDAAAVRRLLGFDTDRDPVDARVDARWSRDGVDGEEVSWSVGYGPRTRARYLRPAGVAGPLPGVLALYGHDGYKYHGLEKVSSTGSNSAGSADGPQGTVPEVAPLRHATASPPHTWPPARICGPDHSAVWACPAAAAGRRCCRRPRPGSAPPSSWA